VVTSGRCRSSQLWRRVGTRKSGVDTDKALLEAEVQNKQKSDAQNRNDQTENRHILGDGRVLLGETVGGGFGEPVIVECRTQKKENGDYHRHDEQYVVRAFGYTRRHVCTTNY